MQLDNLVIVAEIEEGLEARSKREPRWERNRGFYYNEPQTTDSTGASAESSAHTPLVQPILDALGSNVANVITSKEPYVGARCFKLRDKEEVIERVVQFFLDNGDIRDALSEVAIPAGWANLGLIYTEWNEEDKLFNFRVLEPTSCVVYPPFVDRLEDAKLIGHMFKRRRSEIEAMKKSGEYLSDDVSEASDDSPEDIGEAGSEAGRPLEYNPVTEKDEKVELWWCLRKEDSGWVNYVVELGSKEILKKEDWPKDVSLPYSEFRYKPTSSLDGYFPAGSVAQDLQQHQIDLNWAMNSFKDGVAANTHPINFINGGNQAKKASIKPKPGDLVEAPIDGMVTVHARQDLSPYPVMMELIINRAEAAARVSGMASGVSPAGVDTATEAGGILAGQQRTLDDYIKTFMRGLLQIAEFIRSYLAYDTSWQEEYADYLGLEEEDFEVFKYRVVWRGMVDSVGSTPAAQYAAAMAVLQTAMADKTGATGLDAYEAMSRVLDLAQRMGMSDAKDIQKPKDPVELVPWIANIFEVPEEIVAAHLADIIGQATALEEGLAGLTSGGMGQLPGLPGTQGVPGGDGLPDGSMLSGVGAMQGGQAPGTPGGTEGLPGTSG